MSEQHKAQVRQFVEEVINRSNLDVLDELIHPDYTDRSYDHVALLGHEVRGPEAVRVWAPYLRSVYPDVHQEIFEMCADGDLVAWRSVQTGTPRGFLEGKSPGVSPDRRRVERMEMHLVRFKDGRMIEHWGPFSRRVPSEERDGAVGSVA